MKSILHVAMACLLFCTACFHSSAKSKPSSKTVKPAPSSRPSSKPLKKKSKPPFVKRLPFLFKSIRQGNCVYGFSYTMQRIVIDASNKNEVARSVLRGIVRNRRRSMDIFMVVKYSIMLNEIHQNDHLKVSKKLRMIRMQYLLLLIGHHAMNHCNNMKSFNGVYPFNAKKKSVKKNSKRNPLEL